MRTLALHKICDFAAGLGFEPRLAVPKAAVLPLDDPALRSYRNVGLDNGKLCLPLDDPAIFQCGSDSGKGTPYHDDDPTIGIIH